MESSIAEFLMRQSACELLPTFPAPFGGGVAQKVLPLFSGEGLRKGFWLLSVGGLCRRFCLHSSTSGCAKGFGSLRRRGCAEGFVSILGRGVAQRVWVPFGRRGCAEGFGFFFEPPSPKPPTLGV
jgi:hypothetical protein